MFVVKRRGIKQRFDERKLYASIYSAALVAGYGELKAEKFADSICSIIKKRYSKKTVTSTELKKQTIKEIKKKDKDIAFLYETHLDLS